MRLKKFNFKNVNSTNDVAIRIIRNLKYKSGIITAETQKKGRGQYSKKWVSYKGNLFATIFFRIDQIDLTLEELTKVNSLLVKKLLSFYYRKKITIKKPNDLLINKKKISGILQEKLTNFNQTFIIVGIGINLVKSPCIKNYPTTNFYELTNIKIDKNKIISDLKKIYEKIIPKLNNLDILNIKKI